MPGLTLSAERFETLIDDFYIYLDIIARPPVVTMEAWFRKVAQYAEKDVEQAFEVMKDTVKDKPRNLPKAIKAALGDVWRDRGEDEFHWKDYGPCNDCGGCGYFRILHYHTQLKRDYVLQIYCGSCNNYLNLAGEDAPRTTARYLCEIEARWKRGNASVYPGEPVAGQGSVDQIKNMAHDSHTFPSGPVGGHGRHLTQSEKDEFVRLYG